MLMLEGCIANEDESDERPSGRACPIPCARSANASAPVRASCCLLCVLEFRGSPVIASTSGPPAVAGEFERCERAGVASFPLGLFDDMHGDDVESERLATRGPTCMERNAPVKERNDDLDARGTAMLFCAMVVKWRQAKAGPARFVHDVNHISTSVKTSRQAGFFTFSHVNLVGPLAPKPCALGS